jgi:hypothetical protein
MTKTATFIGVALATTVLAIVTRPRTEPFQPDEAVGQPLFAEFEDPLTAKSLEVVRFDQDLGELKSFKVAQENGLWVIPSHQNYPADAEDQMRDAATMFVDLDVISLATNADGEHAEFGVVQPDKDKLTVGSEGVGTLVTIQDEQKKNLVQLVIGKEVPDREGQRYVRVPGQSPVYTVEIDPEKLSTRFEDWIETDLLALNPFDIDKITLKDYSVEIGQGLDGYLRITNYDQRLSMTVHREDSGEWELDEFLENRGEGLQPGQLLEGEVLSKERLDTLRDSLDDLKIVDVERKPKGMGADLKADKGFLSNQEGMASLIERGFYPVPINDTETDLWSSSGEILVDDNDGVQYVLRFGKVAGVAQADQGEGEEEGTLNRFLFVTARVNEDKFPMPELEEPPRASATDAEPQGSDPGEANDPAAGVVEGGTPDNSGTEDANDGPASAETDSPDEGEDDNAGATSPAEDAAATDGSAAPADDTPATGEATADGDASGDPPSADDGEDTGSPDASEASGQSEDAEETDPADEIARITRENQRKLDERQEKLDSARTKVGELNYRFADWYYVISEEVFRKLHLGRDDLIEVSEEAQKEGFGLDAFRELERQGVQSEDDPDSSE